MSERFDLGPLELSEAEQDRLVAVIMARTASELSRRSADISPFLVLTDWARPALAAAALVAAISLGVLARNDHVEPGGGLTDALAVPAPVNEWLISGREPTVADLLIAMDAEDD